MTKRPALATFPAAHVAPARVATLLVALGVGVALAGCGNSTQPTPTETSSAQSQPTSSSVPATPQAAYDISRVDNVKDAFPAGFQIEAYPAKTLDQHDIDSSGVNAFAGADFDPPQCRSLVVSPSADPSVGTQAAGVRAHGDQGDIYVVALRLPQPVPAGSPPADCDQVSISGSQQAAGTAERIPGPDIAGAGTTGVKLSTNDEDDPDYLFTAALDDQTSVVVMGSTDAQINPPQFLSDLLVKAASAVRGQ